MVFARVLGLGLVASVLLACNPTDDDGGVSRSACGHAVAYQGDLDGFNADIRVVENTTLDPYTVEIYVSLPGGGVSNGTVEMTRCGEIHTTARGSAGSFEIVGFLTEDSASGTWRNDVRGESGDWIAEIDQTE